MTKDYLIKFNDDGTRGTTYANNIHYEIISPKPIIEMDEKGNQTITGYTDEEIINLDENFNYEKLLKEGYEWIDTNTYNKIIGNIDGQEYIKKDTTFILKPPYEPSLEELKENKINEAGEIFAKKRDCVRFVQVDEKNIYGFDCASEDITNFIAAYIGLSNNLTRSNTTFYKVWLDENTKGIVGLTLEQMNIVFNAVRNSQFEAYAWYEQIKHKIENCQTKEDLEQIQLE